MADLNEANGAETVSVAKANGYGKSIAFVRCDVAKESDVAALVTAVAVAGTISHGMHAVLQVFGIWAVLSGLFQLMTGVRRWKSYGAQWAMILSGAQSGLAGAHMLAKAAGPAPVGIADIAPYAAFGAFYFIISAVSLTVSARRRSRVAA